MMKVILLGLRASGKTTLGGLLARRWGAPFVDLDDRTAIALGCSTAGEAIRAAGIDRFREAESKALAEVLTLDRGILSLGGGTPMAPGAADLLQRERASRSAVTVYLHAVASVLRARLEGAASDRPALTALGTLDEVESLYAARDPIYRSLADHIVEVGPLSPEAATEVLLKLLPRP